MDTKVHFSSPTAPIDQLPLSELLKIQQQIDKLVTLKKNTPSQSADQEKHADTVVNPMDYEYTVPRKVTIKDHWKKPLQYKQATNIKYCPTYKKIPNKTTRPISRQLQNQNTNKNNRASPTKFDRSRQLPTTKKSHPLSLETKQDGHILVQNSKDKT